MIISDHEFNAAIGELVRQRDDALMRCMLLSKQNADLLNQIEILKSKADGNDEPT